jgi:hypothetical protein
MFKLPKRVIIYKIRIVYKSGYFHDFEAREFTITPGKSINWTHADNGNRPLFIGFDEIAAVYQVGCRKIWTFQ